MLPRRPTIALIVALAVGLLGLGLLIGRLTAETGVGGPVEPMAPAATTDAGAGAGAPLATPARAAGWQASAPRPGLDDPRAGEPIELGLRQRYAGPGERIAARVEVTDPTGAVAAADVVLVGDAWAVLVYPAAFPGAGPTRAGVYRVHHLVDGAAVAADGFAVR
jgi:hypothetical protein